MYGRVSNVGFTQRMKIERERVCVCVRRGVGRFL